MVELGSGSQRKKELSQVIYEQTGVIKTLRLSGVKETRCFLTNQLNLKGRWKVPDNRPLADFAPTIILKAKDFAAEITIFNAKKNSMKTEAVISGNISLIMKLFVRRSWNAAFNQKYLLLLKTSKKLSVVWSRR